MAEQYLALYRKYRPQTFDDVRGRDAIVKTLRNQIAAGRIGHSYLFCGTRGTGKTTIAKIFAKAANCENPVNGNPCGECASCKAIDRNANLNVVEMDAASNNGVEDIRKIIEEVAYSPTEGKYRVYIIDEAHMLSTPAFNALLKTLEEPPSYAIFILATTEPNKLPVTILSRCQRYDFGRLSAAVIEKRLEEVCEREGIHADPQALTYLSVMADGSLRDGLSLLDQCNAFNFGEELLSYEKTLEVLGAVDTEVFHHLFTDLHEGHAAEALTKLEEVLVQGRELSQLVTDLVKYYRGLMLLKASEQTAVSLDVSAEDLQIMTGDAERATMPEIMRCLRVLSALIEQIRYASNRRILAEMAFIRLATPAMDAGDASLQEDREAAYDSLQDRIRMLERYLAEDEALLAQGGIRRTDGRRSRAEEAEEAPVLSEEEKKALEAALPEDIREIVKNWGKIISTMEDGILKVQLEDAKLSLGDEGQLLIVFRDEIKYRRLTEDGANRESFENHLQKTVGKAVRTEYKFLDKDSKFTENYVDLRSVVKMDIVVE